MHPEEALVNRWSAAAPFWEKYRETIRQMFVPVTRALTEDALIAEGQAVLDIATGPGEPALDLAAVVGPAGRIVGIDPIPQMVAAARREAERRGLRNTRFEVGFADRLPLPDESFDAAVSRFGAMFFPSPVDGVREMLRVLKPGQKLALAAWSFEDRNPFFHAISQAIERNVEAPAPAPDASDPFRFAPPGALLRVLDEAGAVATSERLLQFRIEAAISAEDFWTLRCEMSEKLRETVATLSEAQLATVKRESLAALAEFVRDGGMSISAEVLIVSGFRG